LADKTIIAWTDHTWNIAWGCFKVSPGCKNCYADTLSQLRYRDGEGKPNVIWGPPAQTARRTFGPAHWKDPLKFEKVAALEGPKPTDDGGTRPHLVFSSSMCDVFEDHPQIAAERAKLWPLIRSTPHLHWQLLTKRHDRIAQSLPDDWGPEGYPNVWLGVSIESDAYVHRMDALRDIPARVRFISYEPVLGDIPSLDMRGLDWLIVGGESGPGYRMPLDGKPVDAKRLTPAQRAIADAQWWAVMRELRARCASAGVAFFYKQSAAWRTELGTTWEDTGEHVRAYPTPRGWSPERLFA
jgi:protein gp37